MLFRRQTLDGIAAGTVSLAFRRWVRPRVRRDGTVRTAIGVVQIDAVDVVDEAAVTAEQPLRAGYPSRDELLAELEARPDGDLYRIRLHLVGPDPRVELRERADLTDGELGELIGRLGRLDRASRHGAWTGAVLGLIDKWPATRAGDLAARLDRDTRLFMLDVRKLKNLGLTESLDTGYRLSPRGRTVLARLSGTPSGPGPHGGSGPRTRR
ncbi:MAG: hypothetical protein GEV09_18075 [Pseudonocardiaceae bacterium]|nr:hypothetical protein [Pseudonocardiaceae bacterium]